MQGLALLCVRSTLSYTCSPSKQLGPEVPPGEEDERPFTQVSCLEV